MSPCGIGVEQFQTKILNGESGISEIDLFEGAPTPGHFGGQIKDFNDETIKKVYLKNHRKSLKVMCRDIQLGVASANLALNDSGLDLEKVPKIRLGVEFGANLMLSPPDDLGGGCFNSLKEDKSFDVDQWGHNGLSKLEPLWLLKYLPNMPACHIGIQIDAQGPNNSLTQDDASGILALGEAKRIIERSAADIMVCGATGTRVTPTKTVHAAMWDQIGSADDATKVSRPFDATRNGQAVAEGSATFILEELEEAKARNAKIYAEVLGTGSSTAYHADRTPDYTTALIGAMKAALRNAKLTPDDIGSLNAFGLSDKVIDACEAKAIQSVFGERGRTIPVTALKSMIGNTASASGIIEICGSILSLRKNLIPATINYNKPDPECAINVVHGENMPCDNMIFMKISVTRMGQAAAAILKVYPE
jgi:3-oxoacyl-[acyl-carrier-protein] synthase II